MDGVPPAVALEENSAVGGHLPIDRDQHDIPPGALAVVDLDDVLGALDPEGHFIAGPSGRYARLNTKPLSLPLDSEQGLDRHAIHPAAGAGVPGPSAASCMAR